MGQFMSLLQVGLASLQRERIDILRFPLGSILLRQSMLRSGDEYDATALLLLYTTSDSKRTVSQRFRTLIAIFLPFQDCTTDGHL